MNLDSQSNNKRIAKNTILLYLRTLFVMFISLFTSRVILQVLGVDDFGIYNVVGGTVAMFSVLTGALSGAISRYITYELGKQNRERLSTIFSTSLNIQFALSIIIVVLGETVGLWFLNYKMNIPNDRMFAANWVLHCTLLTFVINLINVPYNAAIIAHERMSAFAYVSVLEISLKLIIVYMLFISPIDKLIAYSILLVFVQVIIRLVYGIYCNRNFEECKYKMVHDRGLIKEMAGFAGWSFFTNAAYLFNTQGVNILINMFFGVGVNAARGIATQVESAIMKFVNDFTTAINPQITKTYAQGDFISMNNLICRGAKFSFYLQLIMCIPVFMEAEYILALWLGGVPEHTAAFLRLTIIGTMIERLGNTGMTACLATGKIQRYVLCVSGTGCLVFPLSYVVYKLGAPVEASYVVFICVYIMVNVVRLWVMKGLLNFPVLKFVKDVYGRCSITTFFAVIFPILVVWNIEQSITRLVVSLLVGGASVIICTYILGISNGERRSINRQINIVINKKILKK